MSKQKGDNMSREDKAIRRGMECAAKAIVSSWAEYHESASASIDADAASDLINRVARIIEAFVSPSEAGAFAIKEGASLTSYQAEAYFFSDDPGETIAGGFSPLDILIAIEGDGVSGNETLGEIRECLNHLEQHGLVERTP